MTNIGQELANVPIGEMIRNMASAIADSQFALDIKSLRAAQFMGGFQTRPSEDGKKTLVEDTRLFFGYHYEPALDAEKKAQQVGERGVWNRVAEKASLMDLGFTPNFYQFTETVLEVKVALKMTRSSAEQRREQTQTSSTTKAAASINLFFVRASTSTSETRASSVDATYSNRYSYSAEGSSLVRTKMVPIPPPPALEERIRRVAALERAVQTQVRDGDIQVNHGVVADA